MVCVVVIFPLGSTFGAVEGWRRDSGTLATGGGRGGGGGGTHRPMLKMVDCSLPHVTNQQYHWRR